MYVRIYIHYYMCVYVHIYAYVYIYLCMYICIYTHTPEEAMHCQTLSWVLLSQRAFQTENERILWATCLPNIPFIPKLQNLSAQFLLEEGRQPPTHGLQGVSEQAWPF